MGLKSLLIYQVFTFLLSGSASKQKPNERPHRVQKLQISKKQLAVQTVWSLTMKPKHLKLLNHSHKTSGWRQ